MLMKNILLQVGDDGIGVATFDMPGKPFNVFSEDLMADLETLIEFTKTDLKGLIITSGKSAFVAGADLAMIKNFANMRFLSSDQEMRDRFSRLGRLFRSLELLPVPVVAAVNGLALGGGLELAMACHARVCINTPHPTLGLPEILLGLLPGAGGTQRLPRYVGADAAIKMLLGGEAITPAKALELGLVDAVADSDQLLEKAMDLVRSVTAGARWDQPEWDITSADRERLENKQDWEDYCHEVSGWQSRQHGLYPAVAAIISCVGEGLALDFDQGSDREWDIFVSLMKDPIVANMVLTCFLNKTAAPKIAARVVPVSDGEQYTFNWLSEQLEPVKLKKVMVRESTVQAGIVVADSPIPNVDNLIVLNNSILTENLGGASVITYTGELNDVSAVELFCADKSLCQKTYSMAKAMGKIPVWVKSDRGILGRLVIALKSFIRSSGKSKLELTAAASAVGLDDIYRLVNKSDASDRVEIDSSDAYCLGINMLAAMSFAAFSCLECGDIDDAAMLDVLAVYGLHFPEWTGGPISFLAMMQRKEINISLLDSSSLSKLFAIKAKVKALAEYSTLERVLEEA